MIVGGQIEYTVTFGNNGPDPIGGIIPVNIVVPSSITDVSFSSSQGTYDNASKTYTLNSPLNQGEEATITVTGVLSIDYEGSNVEISSVITPPSGVGDPNLSNNTNVLQVPVTKETDITVELSSNEMTPVVGNNIIITVSATNYGPSKASGVLVTVPIPSGYTYQLDNGEGSYNSTNGEWSVGSLGLNETKELAIVIEVDSSGTYQIAATIEGNEPLGGTHPRIDAISPSPIPQEEGSADLEINLASSSTDPNINTNITLSLSAGNNGPDGATGVSVIYVLPSGFTYVSDNGSGSYDSIEGIWTIGNLSNSGSSDLEIEVTVNPTGTHTSTAVISGNEEDPNLSNNSSQLVVNPVENKFAIAGRNFIKNSYGNALNGVPFPDQIQMVRDLGGSMFRIGLTTGADGALSTDRWRKAFNTEVISGYNGSYPENNGLVPYFHSQGMPMLCKFEDRLYNAAGNFSPIWKGTDQQAYDAGYALGNGAATRYAEWFEYFELGNEIELFRKMVIPGSMGDEESDYRVVSQVDGYEVEEPVEIVANYVKGMNDGIKAVKPSAKTMFNTAGYCPLYLMDRVVALIPDLDIVAWHWYDDMLTPDMANIIGGDFDIITFLGERYSKPIWITETGARWRDTLSPADNEQRQINWYNNFIVPGLSNPHTGKIFWFELLDAIKAGEAQQGNGWEQHYGLYYFPDPNFNNPTPKALAELLINE